MGTSERADGLSGVSLKMALMALHLRFTNYGCVCVCQNWGTPEMMFAFGIPDSL